VYHSIIYNGLSTHFSWAPHPWLEGNDFHWTRMTRPLVHPSIFHRNTLTTPALLKLFHPIHRGENISTEKFQPSLPLPLVLLFFYYVKISFRTSIFIIALFDHVFILYNAYFLQCIPHSQPTHLQKPSTRCLHVTCKSLGSQLIVIPQLLYKVLS